MDTPFQLDRPSLLQQQCYVGDAWVDAASGDRFPVMDPGTGRSWASAPDCGEEDVDGAVQAAAAAFASYRNVPAATRAQWLRAWAALLAAHTEDLARLVTHETGKPLADARFELAYAAASAGWFAGEAERIQGVAFAAAGTGPDKQVMTIKQPIGVVAALVPWNLPVAMAVRKAGAALAAGCTLVVKPSPEAPLSALAVALLAREAGVPAGAVNVLTTSRARTPALGAALCTHPLVRKVTFTGSSAVGRTVARLCAEGLKRVTLELGGNCPFLVFADADLAQAADALSVLKWRNAGQTCINANRVYVQRAVAARFAALLCARAQRLVVGHGAVPPAEPDAVPVGPVTTPQTVARVRGLVADAVAKGARVLFGGEEITSPGYFVQPTILADATAAMRVAHEESFAPLLSLFVFDTEAEAVRAANDTPMGLAAYVFTKDVDRSWRLANALDAGMVGVNTNAVSAVDVPFGGLKESGYGKEAGKDVAVDEYLVTKAVSVGVAALDSRL